MQLDECYRILELPDVASEEEVKRAYRDLTKVWHPDRFVHDPSLQQKAQEKLKKINEAYEMIESSRSGNRARSSGDPRQLSRYRKYSFIFTFVGFLILLRRPTLGGFLLAAICFVIAIAFLGAMRRARK